MPLPQSAELFFGLRLTEEQKVYADSCHDNLFTGCHAVSGSGKTTVATGVAKLLKKELHYIFPTVEEKALGFSTGDIKQKESKYLTPLYDALIEIGENPMTAIFNTYDKDKQEEILEIKAQKNRKKNKHKVKNPVEVREGEPWVHAYSHNYMRGSNLKDCIVVIDEAQNLTKRELRKILTRIHDSCHVIVIGDPQQCDLPDPSKSGFMPYLMHYNGQTFAQICTLTKNFRGLISAHAERL